MDNLKQICARIKSLREFSDYSMEEFADKLGIDADSYREFETGEKDITIGLIYSIAAALEIDPTVLILGKDPQSESVSVCYKDKGESIERYPGYAFTSLAADYHGRELEPMIVDVKAGIRPEIMKHSGQEFNYVLNGSIRVIIGMTEYYLSVGDSIYFDANMPHFQLPMTETARFLTVIQK